MKQEPITNPDPNNTDPKYWDKVLKSHGLSMQRAARPRIVKGTREERRARKVIWQDRVKFIGGAYDLERLEEIKAGTSVRGGKRVEPQGHKPY